MADSIATLGLCLRRLTLWRLALVLAFLVLLSRLAYWQLLEHANLSRAAEAQYAVSRPITSERGTIFDRHGRIMATNQERFTLFAEPFRLQVPPSELAASLAPLLESAPLPPATATDEASVALRRQTLISSLTASLQEQVRKWVPLFHRLSREQKEAISRLGVVGLGFDPRGYRVYPDSSVSAQLLGFVGKNERGEDQGYFGIEGYYDLELRGRAGRELSQTTALGLPIALSAKQEQRAQPGRDLVLTIDKALQYRIEQALLRGISTYQAQSGEVVVMDPRTGEILAMASFPNYDPSHFLDFEPKLYRNPVISELYEPGSTIKVLTVAAGIEEKAVTPETTCPRCAGPRVISGFPIRTWNEEYHPDISVRDALAKSDNTAMVFIQEELGQERFLSWLRKFGLDRRTGVDLQGEEQFVFRPDRQWPDIDTATASFGQGIAVTSLNLLRAVSAIANGGFLVQPHAVKAVVENGEKLSVHPDAPERVLSSATAEEVTQLMIYAVEQGDAKWAFPKDLKIAGKTGTAQIAEEGKYQEDKTIASFIGFAPADDPQFAMLVKLREPRSSPWGSETAAPLWFEIARFLY